MPSTTPALQRARTAGADHLRATEVVVSYGDRRVLDGVSITVAADARVGLIGENGAGKSTLLRVLAGAETPDSGEIVRPDATGWLRQEVTPDTAGTVGDLVDAALAGSRAVERELADAGADMGSPDAAVAARAADRYERALAEAERLDVWNADARRDATLAALGLDGVPRTRRLDEVSGGQRSRFALAALLLSRPDALLLDEPTNHLDDAAVAFLEQTLAEWRGPVLFASHDRAFLDEVATDLVDIDPSRSGPRRVGRGAASGVFTEYLAEKAAERARWERQFAEEQDEVERLSESVRTTARAVAPGRPMGNTSKLQYDYKGGRVQSQVSRRVRNAQGRLDDLERSRVDAPTDVLRFAGLPAGSHPLEGGDPAIVADGVAVPGRLAPVSLTLAPRDRVLVTGRNGAGKSTLLALLAGEQRPASGSLQRRHRLRVARLEQDVRWDDPTRTPRELYERAAGASRAEQLPLVSLGLVAERDLDRAVGALSVGQQRRVALATIVARPPHVFLLDEPTNHLSLGLAEELEHALVDYPGAVVVASHDRWLRRRWAGRTLALEPVG